MTPEVQTYKTQTLNQLLINLPQLESQLASEPDAAEARRLGKRIEATQLHIQRLQQELLTNTVDSSESPAEALCQKAARAIVSGKFYMAQKSIMELETIEPFFPALNRLQQDVVSGKPSRSTRSIADGSSPPFLMALVARSKSSAEATQAAPLEAVPGLELPVEPAPPPPWWHNFFEFHIIASCLVLLLLFCAIAAISGTAILEYIIEGI